MTPVVLSPSDAEVNLPFIALNLLNGHLYGATDGVAGSTGLTIDQGILSGAHGIAVAAQARHSDESPGCVFGQFDEDADTSDVADHSVKVGLFVFFEFSFKVACKKCQISG